MFGAALQQAISQRFLEQRGADVHPLKPAQQLDSYPGGARVGDNRARQHVGGDRRLHDGIEARRQRMRRIAKADDGKGRQIAREQIDEKGIDRDEGQRSYFTCPASGKRGWIDQEIREKHGSSLAR